MIHLVKKNQISGHRPDQQPQEMNH